MKFEGEKFFIRFLEESDEETMLDLQLRNKEFFEKYVTTRKKYFYNLESQQELIKENTIKRKKD